MATEPVVGEPDDDDIDLVRRALDGDRDAFGALFVRHRPVAFALCRRVLGRDDVAGDTVQEAALAAFLNLDRLRRAERFGAWLCGIALNIARGWLRAESRADARSLTVGTRRGVDHCPTPEDWALRAELVVAVRDALGGLPPGQREAVQLFYLEGLSGEEVASALSTTTGAVKTRLHKARTSLRRQLAAHHEEVPMPGPVSPDLVTMRVADVRRTVDAKSALRPHLIVLEDDVGARRLPIYVGPSEGTAVALELTGTPMPRPMTHGFLERVIDALGGTLTGVRITRLADETFYAEVALNGPAGESLVDARPSDAITLALLAGLPVHVEAAVLEECERHGHHDISDQAYPDRADRIAADALEFVTGCPPTGTGPD